MIWALVLSFGLAVTPASAAESASSQGVVELVQLLSLRLRLQRLDIEERRALEERLARGERPARLYEEHMSRWLDRGFYRRLATSLVYVPAKSNLFVGKLTRVREGEGWVYFLPHTLPAGHPEKASPCPPNERVEVVPWWARGQRVSVCRESYRPENVFDDVGYCGGQAEPTIPTPPRPGCGCGSLLLGCLPPEDESPRMDQRLMEAMTSEISETGAELMAKGRSFDELMTTSTTWQTGLTRFLYLRREMLALVGSRPYSKALEARLLEMLTSVDLDAPGQWVERTGLYRGSGLFLNTPLTSTYVGTARATMLLLLSQFLCVDFPANNVDRDALLAITHDQHAGVRFEVYSSPMRHQLACSGCHAPMDYGAGFLVGLRPPLFGSVPTNKVVEGRLYMNGAEDLRGSGEGYGALAALVTRQPEFTQCASARLFTYFVGRPPHNTTEERQLLAELAQAFDKSGRRVEVLIRSILLSKAQTEPLALNPSP
ncbi:DUF1585 domain-containing protein [Myxococcus sp. AM010]|nr:DUF1585 domain-containing protein [Myxococcus sp. AM010]